MTESRGGLEAEDRATYDLWCATQVVAYEAAGNTAWYSSTKAMRMKKRGSKPPRDAFTGPFWAVKPWLVQEAIDWFEVALNPRYTFTDWQVLERERRAELAAYVAEDSNPLAQLEWARDLNARRGEFIAEARADGASWADITAASGLSRMTCHALGRAAEMAAVSAAATNDETPF